MHYCPTWQCLLHLYLEYAKYVCTCRVRQVEEIASGLSPVLLPPHSCSSQWENGDFIVWLRSGPVSVLIGLNRELIKPSCV